MSPELQPSLRRRLLVSVVAVALLFAAGAGAFRTLAALKKPPARAPGGPPLPVVRAEQVVRTDHREVLRGYGTARSLRKATVAAEVTGLLTEVSPRLRAGNTVQPPAGARESATHAVEALVTIDDRDLQDQLSRLAADRSEKEAEQARLETEIRTLADQRAVLEKRLSTSRAELARIESLVPRTLTESDLDRQRLAVLLLEQAEAELDAREDLARAQIAMIGARLDALDVSDRMARRDLGRTRVYAPFAGVVAARHVEQGDRVSPGTPLFDLIAPSRVEVEVALPAGRYGDVAEGARIRLRLREDAAMLVDTRVTRIGPRIDPEARTFPVYVDLDDDDVASPVPPGAHVVADVDGPLHAGVLPVPREAFLGDRVFALVREDGEGAPVARERRPRVRAWLPGLALVEPGDGPEDLGDGDVVVVSNLEDIADGSRVRTVGAVTEPPAR